VHDLAVVIVSTNEAKWLRPCLSTVFEHAGSIEIDVVVADNESVDGTRELVESEFPRARVVTCRNHGFGHANNRAALTTDARYVCFLNPDTEIREGSFAELLAAMDTRPTVGLAGVKQVTPDGALFPTIRRFPNAVRALFEALGSERFPFRASWLGERELDLGRYENEIACDWTSGSFLLARREALESSGLFDERYFIYSEETDLCLRIKFAGWEIRHLPTMTILHHAQKAGANPKMEAQLAFASLQYARKNFAAPHRWAYVGARSVGYALRSVYPGGNTAEARQKRIAARRALRTLWRLEKSPFVEPPPAAARVETRWGSSASSPSKRTSSSLR
jgi:N-acetylglucosaminyl-diphospho-decaprenol L-rhamnosyltransferase